MKALVLLVAILMLVIDPASAATERRVALVVGMGAYNYAPHLPNPPNDARAVAKTLARLGFDVEERIDIDFRDLARALREFGIKAQNADVALFYYAGHGMQVDGENFLIPIDAKLERERDLVYEAMRLDLAMGEVAQARTLGMIILDACRNNPFVERLVKVAASTRAVSISEGLARVDDPPQDTLVAMATRANAVAEDGDGKHSPFTEALLANLEVPGLELGLFFRKVRDAVLKVTRGRQEPYTFGSLGAEPFFFNPLPPNRQPIIPALAPVEFNDAAVARPLVIDGIQDPDGDRLVIRITGLPRGGSLNLGSRMLLIGDSLTPEQMKKISFTPDGTVTGQAGPLTFSVEDGRGAIVYGSLFVKLVPSNHPPRVESERILKAVANPLGLRAPSDPDGDALSVIVTEVPKHGTIRNKSGNVVGAGDRLDSAEVEALSYDPGGAQPGEAGLFAFTVDDGKGGRADAKVRVAIVDRPEQAGAVVTAAPPRERPPIPDTGSNTPAPPPPAKSAEAGPPAKEPVRIPLTAAGEPQVAQLLPPPKESKPAQMAAVAPPPSPPQPAPRPPASAPPPSKSDSPPSGVTPAVGVFRAGEALRDCDACPPLVEIRPGSFVMGATSEDPSSRPERKVTIGESFFIGKYEVTAGEWQACVKGGGCKDIPELNAGPANLPARNLDWSDAQDYVTWLSKTTGKHYRLPSEAEWEYAARAASRSTYWWGNDIIKGKANCKDCGGPYDRKLPAPVDANEANPFGLHGTAGGVAEWVADCWFPSHAGAAPDAGIRDKKGCRERVVRGGSWRNDRSYATSASRFYYDAEVRYIANGLRVVREER